MRRIFWSGLCIILIFSLSACSGQRKFLMEDFEKSVSFETGGITVKGRLEYRQSGETTFTVREPENISGIVFTTEEISDADISTGYGETGDRSPVRLLLTIISDVTAKEIYLPAKGEYTYSGAVSSAEYKIVFDCEKSVITAVETGKYIFKFE